MKILIIDTKKLNVPDDEAERLIAKYEEPPKSIAQQIREQLEREGMTVGQIIFKNLVTGYSRSINRLTPREARRRYVERAAEIVREREPRTNERYYMGYYDSEGAFRITDTGIPDIGAFYMQSTAQWHLLREVVGDEALKELIQK